jgi:hypothetical protein
METFWAMVLGFNKQILFLGVDHKIGVADTIMYFGGMSLLWVVVNFAMLA